MNAQRAKVTVRGAVQGVGFRPHVFWLATQLRLHGWVLNSSQGVFIEVEGSPEVLRQFLLRLEREKPPRAVIQRSFRFSTQSATKASRFARAASAVPRPR